MQGPNNASHPREEASKKIRNGGMLIYRWIASAARWTAPGLAMLSLAGLLAVSSTSAVEPEPSLSREAAGSAAIKFHQIQEGSLPGHSLGLVRISETEANSYLRYEMASDLPPGVSKARVRFQPGRPQGFAEVNFDKIKEASKTPPNYLVDYILRGVHTVGVDGTLYGSGGSGQFHLESVTLDGMAMPRVVVDYLIDHYLKAHYPDISVDRPFPLPYSIDKVSVEAGALIVAGRPMRSGR